MRAYKEIPASMLASEAILEAQSLTNDLLAELEQWRDGLEGTNLENSSKYSMLGDAVSTMGSINWEVEPLAQDVRVAVTLLTPRRKKRRTARWARLNNIIAHLSAVVDTLPEAKLEDLQSIISELESVEIPGMYS